jgi:hypothetical protein
MRAAESLQGQSVRMQMTLATEVDGKTSTMAGTVVQDADGSHVRMEVDTSDEGYGETTQTVVVVVGDESWIGGKAVEAALPRGKAWMRGEETAAPDTLTMVEFAGFLRSAVEIEEKGETQVRGKTVTHYEAVVSARDVAEKAEGEIAQLFSDMAGDGDFIFPVEAWVDQAGRVARFSMTLEEAISMTVDFLEYGVSTADIKAPPDSETVSQEEAERLTRG